MFAAVKHIKEEELDRTTSKVIYRLYVFLYDSGVVYILFARIVCDLLFIIGAVSARMIFLF